MSAWGRKSGSETISSDSGYCLGQVLFHSGAFSVQRHLLSSFLVTLLSVEWGTLNGNYMSGTGVDYFTCASSVEEKVTLPVFIHLRSSEQDP